MIDIEAVKEKTKSFLRGTTIEQYEEEVCSRNFEYLRSFSILGVCMTCFTTIYGQIMRDVVTFNTEFLILFAYFLVMLCITFLVKTHTVHIVLELYLWITPLMILGILLGTFLDPTEPSITIMVFLCVLPLFILDRPWRVVTYISAVAAVYTVCCFLAKARELFVADMIDLVLFYFMSVGVNCLILRDRMSNVEYAATMRRMSETDALTNLYNRGAGEQKIRELVAQKRYGMFCIVDIDDFKSINDRFGHVAGDRVLQFLSELLRACFGTSGVIMRMGGDEFAVYVVGATDLAAGTACAQRLFRFVEGFTVPELSDCRIAISLGGAFFVAEDEKNFETLYHESDVMLYQAKSGGKGRYCF